LAGARVDLVGQDEIAENGALAELEAAGALPVGAVDLAAGDVRRQQIRG
jgi:hypothetical protein